MFNVAGSIPVTQNLRSSQKYSASCWSGDWRLWLRRSASAVVVS